MRNAFLTALLCIAVAALCLRLYGLTGIGLGGNDTILYYSLAEQWLTGNFVFRIGESVQVFRPVLMGFNALALKAFGHSDYAIKLANVLLDTVNLLLLAQLAWLISRRRIVVLACAMTYACLPMAVWSARQELAHTLSAFFALGAYLSIWLATAWSGARTCLVYAFLAGLCVAAATLVHEELIFLAVPLTVFLWLGFGQQVVAPSWVLKFSSVAVFSVAPILAAATLWHYEKSAVQAVINKPLTSVAASDSFFPEVFARFLWDGIAGSTSALFALSLMPCIAYLCWQLRRSAYVSNMPAVFWIGFCLLTPVSYILFSAIFFNTFFPRLFLPLVPLLLIVLFHCLAKLVERGNPVVVGVIVAQVVVLIALSNLASFSAFNVANRKFSSTWAEPRWPTGTNLKQGYRQFRFDANYTPNYAMHWGALFDTFSGKVDARNKLLLLPSTVFYSPGRRALQTEVYFGDNAIYRLDHAAQSLDEIIRAHDVRWVVFTVGQLRAAPTRLGRYLYQGRWAPSEPLALAQLYGLVSYSAEAEMRLTLRYLHSVGAVEVFPYPQGSFESRVSRAWLLPR